MRALLIISAFFLNVLLLRAQELTDSVRVTDEIVNMINNSLPLEGFQPLGLRATDYFDKQDFLKEENFRKNLYENGLKTTLSQIDKNLRYISPEQRIRLDIVSHDNLFIRAVGIGAFFFLGVGCENLVNRLNNPHTQLIGGMFPGLFLVPDLGPIPEFDWTVFTESGFDPRVYQVENALPQPFNQELYREQYFQDVLIKKSSNLSIKSKEIQINPNAGKPLQMVLESVPKNLR